MKSRLLFYVFILFCYSANSQNTFPPSGNVGIGISPAIYPLHVFGSGNTSVTIESSTTTGYPQLMLKNAVNSWKQQIHTTTGRYSLVDVSTNNSILNVAMGSPGNSLNITSSSVDILGNIKVGGSGSSYFASNLGIGIATATVPLHIAGNSATTGTHIVAIVGDNSIGFSSGNDANAVFLTEHRGTSYFVNNAATIATYPGVRYGFQKEGSWNMTAGGTSLGGAFVVHTSSGGGATFAPTITEKFRIASSGNVGIATVDPKQKIQIGTNLPVSTSTPDAISMGATLSNSARQNPKLRLWDDDSGSPYGLGVSSYQFDFMIPNAARYVWSVGGAEKMRLQTDGSVGIGTANTGTMKLAVEGTIGARKIVITQVANFPDYVFHPNYKLQSLDSLESSIKKLGHLPDVPSAKDVEKEGLDIAATQTLLLKKIEELTLYIIEQNKQQALQKISLIKIQDELYGKQNTIEEQKCLLDAQHSILLELKQMIQKS